jgi:RHS repeat-associated protein
VVLVGDLHGSNIAAELDGGGNVSEIYTRGINLIKNSVYYYLYNAHGDVVQLADENGAVTKEYHYDAFGVEIGKDGEDTNPWRYCGEYWDEETGTVYLRARSYSPRTGRFSSEDPVKDGLNWYTYSETILSFLWIRLV